MDEAEKDYPEHPSSDNPEGRKEGRKDCESERHILDMVFKMTRVRPDAFAAKDRRTGLLDYSSWIFLVDLQ